MFFADYAAWIYYRNRTKTLNHLLIFHMDAPFKHVRSMQYVAVNALLMIGLLQPSREMRDWSVTVNDCKFTPRSDETYVLRTAVQRTLSWLHWMQRQADHERLSPSQIVRLTNLIADTRCMKMNVEQAECDFLKKESTKLQIYKNEVQSVIDGAKELWDGVNDPSEQKRKDLLYIENYVGNI